MSVIVIMMRVGVVVLRVFVLHIFARVAVAQPTVMIMMATVTMAVSVRVTGVTPPEHVEAECGNGEAGNYAEPGV